MFSARPVQMTKALHRAALSVLLGLALFAPARPAAADDRDLLRTSTANPYVFIILDTSGSMNWTPPCTAAQFSAGQCSTLCPYRDCFTRLQSDDPNSKTYQAKEALYTVLTGLTDIQFGFATYNEDNLSVRGKHWIYKAGNNGVTLPGAGATPATVFPANGADEVFGFLWTCNTGSGNNQTGCASSTPAPLSDPWSVARMQRLPKGGTKFDTAVIFYVSWAGNTYKITYTPTGAGVPSAATIQVIIRADKCTNGSCSNTTLQGTTTMTYTLSTTNGKPDEFLAWDDEAGSTLNTTITASNPTIEYFPQATASDSADTNTCAGWDPNTDSSSDDNSSGYNLKWTNTNTSDPRGSSYYIGDVVPFDWLNDQKQIILGRLAPNLVATPSALPDFRIATYFNNTPSNSDTFLRLKDPNARPLIANGSTPIGATMSNFNTWFSTWKTNAAANDPQWGCRQKYLIFITDGDETCSGTPCSVATTLLNSQGIKTYVIGLGLDTAVGNQLTCMAKNGGTGVPIYPQNEADLITALGNIFSQIKESASSFASAAVPSVQIEAADKIYVSNFTPLDHESIWNGRVDAYLKPLPLTSAGLPDRNSPCPPVGSPSNPRSACHLWDAADQILQQAPLASNLATASVIDATALHLGTSVPTQRRVFYGMAASGNTIPTPIRLFSPPPTPSDPAWSDLFQGMFPGNVASASASRVTDIMTQTLETKNGTINNADGSTTPVTYVLGDTFHADPTVIDKPNDFSRYQADLYSNGVACGDDPSTGAPLNPGYRCFADKLQFRRKLLAVSADDGQVHFFDAGIYQAAAIPKLYDDGTGWEIFAYIPRLGLPIVRDDAEKGVHIFGPDLTPRVQDVFIDSAHNGTPTAAERQWRTVLVGGFREGGKPLGGSRISDFTSGYFALDVTQPDTVNTVTHVPTNALLPSCLSLTNATVANCGTNPFPALLWEFTDSLNGSRLDEDGNGFPDLGQTWSQPTVGRIQIKNSSNQVIDKWVAIFGGGLDADFKTTPRFGNYIYIVDIETGQVLYKQAVAGGVPADPAVIDSNNDGILDTIYIGSTGGFLYRIDMSHPVQLQNVTITTTHGIPAFATNQTVQRITDSTWLPVAIFNTGGRPIYLGATVMFVQSLNGYAIAFGTGDREDLWNFSAPIGTQEGRFYLIVDQGFTSAQTESQYTQITPTGAPNNNDLVSGALPPTGLNRGWYVRLAVSERVITKTFGLSGLIVFSSFQPQVTSTSGPNGPICGRTGQSFVYTIYAKNGNAVLTDPVTNALTRYQEQNVFMAPPTIDQPTKNPYNPRKSAAQLSQAQLDIMKNLMAFFPKGTRFGNFFYVVEAMGSDTRYVGVAAIPVGILERNWKQVQ